MNNMLPNATVIEILQMLLAFVGVTLGFWRLWIAIENGLLITHTQSTDLRRVVAETQILGELFRLFQQGSLLAIGIISVLLPQDNMEVLQSTLTRAGLITLTIAMLVDSVVQEMRRREFLARAWTVPPTTKSEINGLRDDVKAGTAAAHAAYEEANTVNKKISDLNERLVETRTREGL